MYAVYNESPEAVQVLLAAGADLEARDEDGGTALMYAASFSEDPKVAQVLLDAGADLEARSELGWTPLMVAASFSESSDVVQTLLNAGADASPKDRDGKTAWDLIQENEHLEGTPAYWALNQLRFQ
jgi:ankyrin repeat protein